MKVIYKKHNLVFNGPKNKKPKWIKNNSSKAVLAHLKKYIQQDPQYWSSLEPATVDVKQKECSHTVTMFTRGQWGPHRAKVICSECGAYIKWAKAAK